MAIHNTKHRPDNLDKSIDIGLNQFFRFLRGALIWIIPLAVLIFLFNSGVRIANMTGSQWLAMLLQIGFAIFYILIQFIALFWFLGRPRLYWVMPGETGVTFNDYKGNPEVLESAKRIVDVLRGVEQFEKMGGKPIRGLLLSGPPGTGKSYLAQCMSTEAGVPFAYASASSFRAMFIGMDVLMIWRLYRKARKLARQYGSCVIFMDEIDAIGASRGGRGPTMGMGGGAFGMMGGGTGGLNQLLMEMDPPNIETGWFKKVLRVLGLAQGRTQIEPVLTVGATNLPESLDAALLRPGRFDRQIHVAPPTDKYRPEVIEYYLQKVTHDPSISVPKISARLVEYTPVAIKHVINEAVLVAHFAGRTIVTYQDIVEAQDVHEYGLRQVSELTPVDRRRIAYHEAGHAVASYYLYDRYFPAYVTVQMRGDLEGALAFAHPRPKESVKTQVREEILASIQVSLAARAAEELFLNTQMSGVTSDFKHATERAILYISAFGMDGKITSMLAFAEMGQNRFMQEHLMERVEELLQSQMRAVKQLLMDHREALVAIAEALIERDELMADDIKSIIDDADARKVTQAVFSEFTPLLEAGTNSHSHNGTHTNGHVQVVNASSAGNQSLARTADGNFNTHSPLDLPGGHTFQQDLPDTP